MGNPANSQHVHVMQGVVIPQVERVHSSLGGVTFTISMSLTE